MTQDRYAVIGHPVAHSKSPLIHSMFAAALGHTVDYSAVLAPLDGFAQTVRAFRDTGGKGMNVTLPFKLEAFALADTLSVRAQRAGAVNAFKFEADGTLAGENFDGEGLVRDIQHNLKRPVRGARVLLLGAGGGVRGVLGPLLAQSPADIAIVNRTADKATQLALAFRADGPVRGYAYDDLKTAGARGGQAAFDIIINGTSASLDGEVPPLPDAAFAPGALAYDMMYGKGLTPFLAQARRAGAQVADGVGMLVEQAADSFAWWRGVRPDTAAALRALAVPLV